MLINEKAQNIEVQISYNLFNLFSKKTVYQ